MKNNTRRIKKIMRHLKKRNNERKIMKAMQREGKMDSFWKRKNRIAIQVRNREITSAYKSAERRRAA